MRHIIIIAIIRVAWGRGKGDKPDYSVTGLVAQLKDKDPNMRYSAARSLGQYGAEAKPAVPALVEALKDENAMVRSGAAYALGDIGPDATDAVPALNQAANDPSKDVRDAVAYALKRIQAPPKK